MEKEASSTCITLELAQELIVLLNNQNSQVQQGALMGLLQSTTTDSARKCFTSTNLIPLLFSNLFRLNSSFPTLTITALINFSQLPQFAQDYSHQSELILALISKLTQEQITIQNKQIQLYGLLLMNMTRHQSIAQEFFAKKEGQVIPIQNLFIIQEKTANIKNLSYLYSEVFVNLTSFEFGRKEVSKNELYAQYIPGIESQVYGERMAALKIVRNCAFMWEDEQFAKMILKEQHQLLNKIDYNILRLLSLQKLSGSEQERANAIYNKYKDCVVNKSLTKDLQKSIEELELCLDIILILSNANFPALKPEFDQNLLKSLIEILKFNTQLKEETIDKLEALEIFCFW